MARRASRGGLHLPRRQGHSGAHLRRQPAGSGMGGSQSLRCKLTHYRPGRMTFFTGYLHIQGTAAMKLEDHPTVRRIRLKTVNPVLSRNEPLDAQWLKQLVLDAGADDVGFV